MSPPRYEWSDINWGKCRSLVFKLQKRIYKASKCGDLSNVRKLQRLLVNSWSARCLALKMVTQLNKGRNSAGIDGVKSLNNQQKISLINNLKFDGKALSNRRVLISKPGKKEKRLLSIPVIKDRALQALMHMALEPEWEARFEENSYGFRPGRSCHDAIDAIHISLKADSNYVLDADIAPTFDNIDHFALLEKINTFPKFRQQIKVWLEVGVIDGKTFLNTTSGIIQGEILSPLLANIALHGLENTIKDWVENNVKLRYPSGSQKDRRDVRKSVSVIRYVDNFLIMHSDYEIVLKCKQVATEFLANMGLELKQAKTTICHTLERLNEQQPGFNFLGFEIRQHKVGKDQGDKLTGISQHQKSKNYKTIIRPSNESVRKHYNDLKNGLKKRINQSVDTVIAFLNSRIKGWSNYYKYVVSSQVFRQIDDWLYHRYWRWCKGKHPNRGAKYLKRKYFGYGKNGNWVLTSKEKDELFYVTSHRDTAVSRHIKVQEDKSPYDGDWSYWASRNETTHNLHQQLPHC